uniref:Uncharacterized serine/threonine-protein kinase SgK494b n=4 Tax=Nothobranchius TaxID=28779 RepID=A0A1A8LEA9_9TELE
MGADGSKNRKKASGGGEDEHISSGWRGFLSGVGLSIPASVCRLAPPALRLGHHRMLQSKAPEVPEHVLRSVPGHEYFQVLGYIAKGSFGPILKVKDKTRQKTFAVKVIPKSEILRLGVLDQSKEEVIVHTGDLYTYWQMIGQFSEDTVRVFAAELGCALGFLHDFGIIHRDVKMENILLNDNGHLRLADFGLSRRLERGGRAFTICGTIQYMAPEVLSGGPYNHAADWWSLGILLFSLATGKFPVPPEPDHCSMLRKVRSFPYEMPLSFSPPLSLLITELLCQNPSRRLKTLDRFKRQTFFHGISFDLDRLQRQPVEVILELRERPDRVAKARRGLTLSLQPLRGFDFDSLLSPPATPETQLDAGARTAAPLPGPAVKRPQEKGPRREVFV